MSIQSFASQDVEEFFLNGKAPQKEGWASTSRIARRKLDMLHYAIRLGDLRSPPANRLEALKGDWISFYSIRINDQWRVVFKWTLLGPSNVDIVDYHK